MVERVSGHVAEVRTPLGPLVVVRLVAPATRVLLELADGVPTATPTA
jgi:hypothetical protein